MSSEIIKVKALPIDIKPEAVYNIEQNSPNTFTHSFFKYPCKFIPEIPRWAISKYVHSENCDIYDPFSGSGTTLVEAALMGHYSYGSEIDATAKLITRTKSTRLSSAQLRYLENLKRSILSYASDENNEGTIARINNIEHWFPTATIQELARLKFFIEQITDEAIKEFCLVCFASIIKRVSYCDDISPKPYVSSKISKNPEAAIKAFDNIFDRYLHLIKEYSGTEAVRPTLLPGGALGLDEVERFDLAITSPPYINAFDYARSMRLENLWLGYESEESIRNSKKTYVGTESVEQLKLFGKEKYLRESTLLHSYLDRIITVDKKRAAITNRFFTDMKRNLELVHKALKPGCRYIIVIGNSSIRKVNVESWKVLAEIAQKVGFTNELHFSYYIKNPYIRIPREGQGGKINEDHILVLKKM